MVYNLNEHSGLWSHGDACGSMDSKAAPYPTGHKPLIGDQSPAFFLTPQQGPTLELQHNVFYRMYGTPFPSVHWFYDVSNQSIQPIYPLQRCNLDATTKDSIARSPELKYRRLETCKGWSSLNTIICQRLMVYRFRTSRSRLAILSLGDIW